MTKNHVSVYKENSVMLISFTFQIYKNVKIVSQATISPDNFDSFNKIVKYTWFVFFS